MSFSTVFPIVIGATYLTVSIINEIKAKPEEPNLTFIIRRVSMVVYALVIATGVSNVKV